MAAATLPAPAADQDLKRLQVVLLNGKAAEIAVPGNAAVHTLIEEAEQQLKADISSLVHGMSVLEERQTVDAVGLQEQDMLQAVVLPPDPHRTCLASFHRYVNVEDIAGKGEFTKVRKIASTIFGSVKHLKWTTPCGEVLDVAGKFIPAERLQVDEGSQTNDRDLFFSSRRAAYALRQDPRTEVGVLSYLRKQPDLPLFLPKLLGCFQDGERVLMLTELFSGGELFNLVSDGRLGREEGTVQDIMWQLLHGVGYLHAHDIGHRDISLENVVTTLDKGRYRVRLLDFSSAARTRLRCGKSYLRYFNMVSKPYYTAPEIYIPQLSQITTRVPADARGGDIVFAQNPHGPPNAVGLSFEVKLPYDAVPGELTTADVWGYEIPPADVFALGVCLFILAWHVPPWPRAQPGDRAFTYIRQNGFEALLAHWNRQPLSVEGMRVLSSMLEANPQHRWSVQDCLESPWFALLADRPVPVHPA